MGSIQLSDSSTGAGCSMGLSISPELAVSRIPGDLHDQYSGSGILTGPRPGPHVFTGFDELYFFAVETGNDL